MGAIGGSFWHGIKGYRNAPSGIKLRSSVGAIKARAPVLGGTFGGRRMVPACLLLMFLLTFALLDVV